MVAKNIIGKLYSEGMSQLSNLSSEDDEENKERRSDSADIALLLEGTYPYIRGGVSSWVHQIIQGLPQFTFALVFLGGQRKDYDEMKYELPENVVHLEHHYLMDSTRKIVEPKSCPGGAKAFALVDKLHQQFKSDNHYSDDLLEEILSKLGCPSGVTRDDFLHSRASWDMVCEYYMKYCSEPSFIDYFWSVRIMHEPLFTLSEIVGDLPKVKILHSISTGYAGLLGALVNKSRGIPYILTEHGIYTKERKIDLAQASWIYDAEDELSGTLHTEIGHIRRMWIAFYEVLGKIAYQSANPIISLYEGNRERQVSDGADVERTLVVPNGIDPDRFVSVRDNRPEKIPMVLGLIGRVVPIKDIKTFIRSIRGVCDQIEDAEGWIVGPEDEDPSYVLECKELVIGLGLEEKIKFLGFQNIHDILPQLGLLVLTSISEALPLVILEAYAAGLPCLATDVGSCRELIEGGKKEDQLLGSSGRVVPIADPEATAAAAVELLGNEDVWREAQRIGFERVNRYYTQKMMFDNYEYIYSRSMENAWRGLGLR